MYEIQSKTDFQTGVTLCVRIPQGDVDKKALYTILADKPDFVLPFKHRAIDGEIEFIYQIGNRSKLSFLAAKRVPAEYADLWYNLITPLLECNDWFMSPYSFVFKPEYLYCEKNSGIISYVYIPSVKPCSDYDALKAMVTDVAKQNQVTDVNIENKVVWALQDFNPPEFLNLLKPYRKSSLPPAAPEPVQPPAPEPPRPEAKPAIPFFAKPAEKPVIENIKPQPIQQPPPPPPPFKSDEIAINFPPVNKPEKEKKPKAGLFGPKKEKPPKPPKPAPEPKQKSGFWNRKKEQPQEIIQGAAAGYPLNINIQEQPTPPVFNPYQHEEDNVTQIIESAANGPHFRYVGNGKHPSIIEVNITDGGIFTIGRFDASVGIKQSTFEFDNKTKAVSRRHAVIEKNADGYNITDLNSSAGTFINGQKLPPNTPAKMEFGSRISFGYSGADYVWEE